MELILCFVIIIFEMVGGCAVGAVEKLARGALQWWRCSYGGRWSIAPAMHANTITHWPRHGQLPLHAAFVAAVLPLLPAHQVGHNFYGITTRGQWRWLILHCCGDSCSSAPHRLSSTPPAAGGMREIHTGMSRRPTAYAAVRCVLVPCGMPALSGRLIISAAP